MSTSLTTSTSSTNTDPGTPIPPSSTTMTTDYPIDHPSVLLQRISKLENVLTTQLDYTEKIIFEMQNQKSFTEKIILEIQNQNLKLNIQEEINSQNEKYIFTLSQEITDLRQENNELKEQITQQSIQNDTFQSQSVEWLYYLYAHQRKQFEFINQTFLPPLAKAFPDWISALVQKQTTPVSPPNCIDLNGSNVGNNQNQNNNNDENNTQQQNQQIHFHLQNLQNFANLQNNNNNDGNNNDNNGPSLSHDPFEPFSTKTHTEGQNSIPPGSSHNNNNNNTSPPPSHNNTRPTHPTHSHSTRSTTQHSTLVPSPPSSNDHITHTTPPSPHNHLAQQSFNNHHHHPPQSSPHNHLPTQSSPHNHHSRNRNNQNTLNPNRSHNKTPNTSTMINFNDEGEEIDIFYKQQNRNNNNYSGAKGKSNKKNDENFDENNAFFHTSFDDSLDPLDCIDESSDTDDNNCINDDTSAGDYDDFSLEMYSTVQGSSNLTQKSVKSPNLTPKSLSSTQNLTNFPQKSTINQSTHQENGQNYQNHQQNGQNRQQNGQNHQNDQNSSHSLLLQGVNNAHTQNKTISSVPINDTTTTIISSEITSQMNDL